MDGPIDRQTQRRPGARAAALENTHIKSPCRRFECDAQAGGRRRLCDAVRTKQQDQRPARLGRNREPSKLGIADIATPGEQCMTGARAQHLFRRPQEVAALWRAHDRQRA
jgi:hypothetical protein